MDIGSVSSSVSSLLTANAAAQSGYRPSEQTQQAQQAQSALSVDEAEAADRARREAERNRPTVNMNGQVVGTRVNTTA